jgi:hypothetical protein
LLLPESVAATSVADTIVAPVVGNPIEPAGTVVPANALQFAAGVATATLAGAESLPPQPDTAIADAANKALTIAELRRLLNRVLILVSVYFLYRNEWLGCFAQPGATRPLICRTRVQCQPARRTDPCPPTSVFMRRADTLRLIE